ncbi:MAG: tetratricopeptide repeat protein [Alphaproteobacteria bacterium]|nr:tetratricopeptide repeat protein [Alphaproteobacteria bacterium]
MKLLSLIVYVILVSSVAQAQEIIGIQEQIDALKEEIIFLQKKVYREKLDSSVYESNPARAEVKIGEYDEIIRNLNGKIEEFEYKIKGLEEKINTINKDMDIRFRLLEGKSIPAGQASVQTPQKFDVAIANGAPKSITGENITTDELQNLQPEKGQSVEQLYTTALEALKSGDSQKSKSYFNFILENHKNHNLAGNAQYWLGEVYYKDKQFEQAAVAFAKGYNDYKSGSKGADCLLKLGLSMAQIGKKNEACLAFINLHTEFKNAPDSIKAKAKDEAKKMGCE